MDSFLRDNDVFGSSSGSSNNDTTARLHRKRTIRFVDEPKWTDRLDGMMAEHRMHQMKNEELKAEIQTLREALDEATNKGPGSSLETSIDDADVSKLLTACTQHAKLELSDIDPAYVGAQRVMHLIKAAIAKLESRVADMAGEVVQARKTEGAFHGLTWAQLRLAARCESLEEKCGRLERAKQDLEREVAFLTEKLKYDGGGGGRGAETTSTSTSNNFTTAAAAAGTSNIDDEDRGPPPSPAFPPPRWSYGPPRACRCRAAAVYRRDAEALCAANMGLLHVNGELWERLRRIRAAAEDECAEEEDLREMIFGLVVEDEEDGEDQQQQER